MNEYTIFEVKCRKELKLTDIYAKIKETVKYNSNFFELRDLDNFHFLSEEERKRFEMSKANRKIFDEIGLERFSYVKVLEHLTKSEFYDPKRDDRKIISNMDSRWEWHNENLNEPLSEEDFYKLINFCDALKSLEVALLMIGFDEIEWDGNKPKKGTYGYQKADNKSSLGRNYLSNSITVGKWSSDKNYTVYVSCEKCFAELEVIKDIIGFIGDIKNTYSYFSPENDSERQDWEKTYEAAEIKFQNALSDIKALPLEDMTKEEYENAQIPLGERVAIERKEKINVKKYIKNYLCDDVWKIDKPLPDEISGTKVCKKINGTIVSLFVVPGHNGHHIQLLLGYRNVNFFFLENICYSVDTVLDSHIEKYFSNLKMIRDHIDKALLAE